MYLLKILDYKQQKPNLARKESSVDFYSEEAGTMVVLGIQMGRIHKQSYQARVSQLQLLSPFPSSIQSPGRGSSELGHMPTPWLEEVDTLSSIPNRVT